MADVFPSFSSDEDSVSIGCLSVQVVGPMFGVRWLVRWPVRGLSCCARCSDCVFLFSSVQVGPLPFGRYDCYDVYISCGAVSRHFHHPVIHVKLSNPRPVVMTTCLLSHRLTFNQILI